MHRNIDRRRLMKTAGAMALAAAAGAVRSEQAFAQQVAWSVKVRSYPVAVESGEELQKGPIFSVHVEDSYVIIET